MKKLILVAAMLAVALLVAAPAVMADTTQTNTGDVIAVNRSTQEQDQYQFAPGGDAQYNVDESENDIENDLLIVDVNDNNGQRLLEEDNGFDLFIFEGGDRDIDNDVDQEAGDGGTQRAYQSNNQDATATGATFNAR